MKPAARFLAAALLLCLALPVAAGDAIALTSQSLLAQLQRYMQEHGAVAEELTPRQAAELMVDWYRFSAGAAADKEDSLVFRYGGWSEGCATAFNLSLLRRVKQDGNADLVAGITLMFEPSSQVELKPFSDSTTGTASLETFVRNVEASPAFRLLGDAKPMSVLLESGGLR